MRERVSVRVRETEAEMIEKHRQETDWKRKSYCEIKYSMAHKVCLSEMFACIRVSSLKTLMQCLHYLFKPFCMSRDFFNFRLNVFAALPTFSQIRTRLKRFTQFNRYSRNDMNRKPLIPVSIKRCRSCIIHLIFASLCRVP